MPGTADHEKERAELATLLESGAFSRAPNLASLLTYVCQRYFEGKADELKEYNLAVEALGRPPDFDNKKDSVVRVEAHRLRRRLSEYYRTQGADHEVQIELPAGQYAPRFLHRTTQELVAAEAAVPVEAAPNVELQTVEGPRSVFTPLIRRAKAVPGWMAGTAVVLVVAAVVAVFVPGRARTSAKTNAVAVEVASGETIRILAGADEGYEDSYGQKWMADRYYSGGTTFTDPQHQVFATRDPKIYRTRREGIFKYDIPLKPGVYELRLHFAETLYGESNIAAGGESTRIFSVWANGKMLVDTLDVISDAGPNTADIRVFRDIRPDSDGMLHLQFEATTNPAFLNAVEILPGMPGQMRPIRLVARDHPYRDGMGRTWEADRYARGGQLVNRGDAVMGAEDPELFRGERFGNFAYSIPVAREGRYGVTLYFSELWFGPNKPGKGGAGNRLFDVLCNGVALVRNLDIYKEAGGGNRALVKTFHNLEPTAAGRLEISFVPRKNYGLVNAIEVIDESK